MIKVKYNNQFYDCYYLWDVLKKDAEQIMRDLIEIVKAGDGYEPDDADDIFLGEYYADHVVFDGKTYTFDFYSINDLTYSTSVETEIASFLTHEINAKIPDCCEWEYKY